MNKQMPRNEPRTLVVNRIVPESFVRYHEINLVVLSRGDYGRFRSNGT